MKPLQENRLTVQYNHANYRSHPIAFSTLTSNIHDRLYPDCSNSEFSLLHIFDIVGIAVHSIT